MTYLTAIEEAQHTRETYWQAMRETCARIRFGEPVTSRARVTLAHFYSRWRTAFDTVHAQEEQRKAA